MTQDMPVLSLKNLSKFYGGKMAVNNVSLDIYPGRIVGLLGPNGSGKTTIIKMISGLLTPTLGEIIIDGFKPGIETKARVSYLPERTYLDDRSRVQDSFNMFSEFYEDFDPNRAYDMIKRLNIDPSQRFKEMSKGTKEKVQLILVMSRKARLYLLDEPIGGVDPAARDYILDTIIGNYSPESSVIISTHLISDVEKTLDDIIFINQGLISLVSSVDDIRAEHHKSVDELFREVFKC